MENPNKSKFKVLIAEDEKPLSKALMLKLQMEGMEVDVAEDGRIAYDLTKTKKYDLIALDLVMPVMDGFDVMKRLKQDGDRTPIVVLSNLSQEEDIKKAKELGALEFFIKSGTPLATLVDFIKNYFKLS